MRSPVTALLGPTNTGKTYIAVERMLAHRTGMIGFPLRLLARENYDRRGRSSGARTRSPSSPGEERIVPRGASYFVCTVEAMPLDRRVDFLAVDEIQLAADRERGHVFTDRLLHARGRRGDDGSWAPRPSGPCCASSCPMPPSSRASGSPP